MALPHKAFSSAQQKKDWAVVWSGWSNGKNYRKALNIPERYEILLVLTIGKPKETFVFEVLEPNTENVRGWWDEQGGRHIPKRKLEDIIIG